MMPPIDTNLLRHTGKNDQFTHPVPAGQIQPRRGSAMERRFAWVLRIFRWSQTAS